MESNSLLTSESAQLEPNQCISIPAGPEEITAQWFGSITGISIPDSNTFQILTNPSSSVGNLSQMIRVGFVGPIEGDNCESAGASNQRSYMIKLLPVPKDDFSRSLLSIITSENMDGREVFFYSKLKSQLERIVLNLGDNFVKCYQSLKNSKGSLIILQDLGPLGYWMPTFSQGLSQQHLDQALQFTAQFHFAGEILQHEYGDLPGTFSSLNTWHVPRSREDLFQEFTSLIWFAEGLEFLAQHLLPQDQGSVYRALIPYAEKIIRWIVEIGSKYPTIVHDDLWPQNFLCHSSKHLKVIDWQLLGFTDPAYELSFFLLTSLPTVMINRSVITEALMIYHRLKEKLYETRKLRSGRTFDEFQQFFNTYGLCYGFLNVTMSADSIYANESNRLKLITIYNYLWEAKIPQFLLANCVNI